MHTYTYICMYIYIYIHMYIHVYVYMYMYAHTYIHIIILITVRFAWATTRIAKLRHLERVWVKSWSGQLVALCKVWLGDSLSVDSSYGNWTYPFGDSFFRPPSRTLRLHGGALSASGPILILRIWISGGFTKAVLMEWASRWIRGVPGIVWLRILGRADS